MAASCQTVEQTVADAVSWRPVLEPILRAFEPLLTAQSELADKLAEAARGEGLSLPEARPERMQQGLSLLAGTPLTGIAGLTRVSAEKVLPLLEGIQALAPHMSALQAFFLRPMANTTAAEKDSREAFVEAMIAGERAALARIADEHDLDPLFLEFAAGFVVSPVLRALAAQALSEDGHGLWDEGDNWSQGYCPVCGSFPSIGWLDKPALDEKNAYLADGGGKKHLHCGLCGVNWKFRRGACPSCAKEGNGVMENLRESGVSHGERLDWCTQCRTYCPTVDLREREYVPDPEAAALGMMHLDMVAARKHLRPLRPSFWNMF